MQTLATALTPLFATSRGFSFRAYEIAASTTVETFFFCGNRYASSSVSRSFLAVHHPSTANTSSIPAVHHAPAAKFPGI
jgi:hypothetical protein